ncbi:hypothetical protein F3I27_23115 [Pantoea sp. Bo_2]|uniref:Uncharacterized protein n=1 Tax=Candidatus Pantoea gossypiicola TaxID=2608008 RepID=A0AB34CD04_9GAMM|nr:MULTISPECIES: hypothetical protein [Pantoea]KAA5923430.1 hypothetical protein F3I59_21045 [Pantoea sp. VH_8]KAA5929174.1 hypothetical protein F3I58_21260 [Pantoea sp. VH_4]KAA5975538.1 hypothetical protein F3I48_23765 [Pantoea sp. M_3]KAA5980142.1 hypothetical protein F3I49_20940 [Pantoea sp. M_4]KAA6038664.1 hypothetical protein F3I36_23740 [Pantoea sp. FN_2b]
MNDIEKAQVARLVSRLEDLKARSNGTFNPPAWMLDKNRYGKNSLTPQEQQEWAESVSHSMRSTVALSYLIECGNRWGMRDGQHVFRAGNTALGLTRELIENVLIVHVENAILSEQPEQKYLAVYLFYARNDEEKERRGYSWFSDFLDDLFIDVAAQLRAGETTAINSQIH